ncbi:hypothetical protein KAR91_25745 [Candidatus Pacearchaeota archaeon]|nr:hypothetical protein [Candidatus Pacearchaeota archaeon]
MTIHKTDIQPVFHDMPGIGIIDYSFDTAKNELKIDISYSSKINGRQARQLWDKLTLYNDPDSNLLESKRIAALICGVERFNSKSRKPNQVFFRNLVMWYAFRMLRFSIDKVTTIFDIKINTCYYGIYKIEKNENELLYDQIEWRRQFMEQIKKI